MIDYVTTMSQAQYENHGRDMLESVEKYMTGGQLYLYADFVPEREYENVTVVSFSDACPNHAFFARQFQAVQNQHITAAINSQTYEDQKMFLFDGVRFSYKMFVLIASAASLESRYLVWLDADTVMTDHFSSFWVIDKLTTRDSFVTYLGRVAPYTETGFLLFDRLRKEEWDYFFNELIFYYHSGGLAKLPYYIDCVVFDTIVNGIENPDRLFNLTPEKSGNVWKESVLQEKMTHFKGLAKIKT